MIRTLKKTITDTVTDSAFVNPVKVEQFLADLTDEKNTHIFSGFVGYGDRNYQYINTNIRNASDVVSLFRSVNVVLDDLFSRIEFTKTQRLDDLTDIHWDYEAFWHQYSHFHQYIINYIVEPDIDSEHYVQLNLDYTDDDLVSIKSVLKGEYTLLHDKAKAQYDEIKKFTNANMSLARKVYELNQIANNSIRWLIQAANECLNALKA